MQMARIRAAKMPEKYAFVSEDEYGSAWPYVFPFGLLECKDYSDVVIIADHKVYAVNGSAKGAKYRNGARRYEDDWKVRKPLSKSTRMGPPRGFIDKGLALCKKSFSTR